MKHCRDLDFEAKPNYQYILDLLRGLGEKEGLNLEDQEFDWAIKVQKVYNNSLNRNSLMINEEEEKKVEEEQAPVNEGEPINK